MDAGRNDPCPCGSGKKYKKCCLQKDVAAAPRTVLDFGYESDLAVRGKAIGKIDALLREMVDQDEVREFIDEFWTPYFVSDADIQTLRADAEARGPLERQLPLAIRNALVIDDAYPAEYLLRESPERFTAAEQAFLRRYIDARITFIQLREFFPEAGYTLADDLFDGREFRIFDKAISQSGPPHAIVSARLVELPDGRGHVLEQVGLGLFFPEEKPIIVAALQEEARRFSASEWGETLRGQVPAGAVHAMLREEPLFVYGIEILIACRRRVPPRLSNTDGDILTRIEARYRCNDPQALKAALLAQPNITHQAAGGSDLFIWTNRKDTVIGTARLHTETGELCAETNSRARHRKWEKKLQSLGALTFLEKREVPVDLESSPDADPAPGEAGRQILAGEELEALLPQIKAQLAERWLREKIPMLGGKTPLQAAKTEKGRKELRELFAYIESQDARRPKGDFETGWNVGEMKKRLGLPDD